MNSFKNIKNLTELVTASNHVKLIIDHLGRIHSVYALDPVSNQQIFLKKLAGKSLADCIKFELVKKITETVQIVQNNQQPIIEFFSINSQHGPIELVCDVMPISDQTFVVNLVRNDAYSGTKVSSRQNSDMLNQMASSDIDTTLQSIFDQTQEIWFAMTSSGKIIHGNREFLLLINYNERELENLELADLLTPQQLEMVLSILQSSPKQEPEFMEIRFLSKSGETIRTKLKLIQVSNTNNDRIIIGIVNKFSTDSKSTINSAPDQFMKLTSKVPVPLLLVDELSLEILFANPAANNYLEYEDDQLVRSNLFDLFPMSENHYLVHVIRESGVLGLEANYSWRLVTRNGIEKTTRFVIQQVLFENQKTLIVIILDKENDNKLNFIKEDSKILEMFDADLLVVRLSPDGIISQVNKNFGDLIGRPLRKIIGRSIQENLFVEDYEAIHNHLSQLTPKDPVKKNVNRMINADGEVIWVEWTDKGIFEGDQLVEVYGLGRNITETYKQDLLQQSMEQRFQALVENLPMVTYVIHATTLFPLYISPSIKSFTGYDVEEFLTNPNFWLSIMHPEDAKDFYKNMSERIEKNDATPITFRMYHKDGHLIWAEEVGSTITLNDGTILFQGASRDITESRTLQEKLEYDNRLRGVLNEASLNLLLANQENYKEIVQETIGTIGRTLQLDRVIVFEKDKSNQSSSTTFEWCNEGIASHKQNLQSVSHSSFPWWRREMESNHQIIMNSLDELPVEAIAERENLIAQSIKSLMSMPLYSRGRIIGWMGFDMVRKEVHWDKEEINLLRLLSALIVNTHERIFQI